MVHHFHNPDTFTILTGSGFADAKQALYEFVFAVVLLRVLVVVPLLLLRSGCAFGTGWRFRRELPLPCSSILQLHLLCVGKTSEIALPL